MTNAPALARHLHIPRILIQAAELDNVLGLLVETHLEGSRIGNLIDDDERFAGLVAVAGVAGE